MELAEALQKITPFSHGALRHEMMKQLLHAIFRGKFPAGTRLMIMKLAEQFGTSSTPVRETLVELAGLGVVDFIHNRGAVVSPFGPPEVDEIYQLRRILETEAARSCCGRIDPAQLEALRDEMCGLLQAEDGAAWSQRATATDKSLHELIAAGCGNNRLAREIHRYDTLVQTIREIIGANYAAQRKALKEHVAILDALTRGEADAAAAAMAFHIRSAADVCQTPMFASRPQGD
jgi:DNA-binding GntR family transcriptional regulator